MNNWWATRACSSYLISGGRTVRLRILKSGNRWRLSVLHAVLAAMAEIQLLHAFHNPLDLVLFVRSVTQTVTSADDLVPCPMDCHGSKQQKSRNFFFFFQFTADFDQRNRFGLAWFKANRCSGRNILKNEWIQLIQKLEPEELFNPKLSVRILNSQKNPWIYWIFLKIFRMFRIFSDYFSWFFSD